MRHSTIVFLSLVSTAACGGTVDTGQDPNSSQPPDSEPPAGVGPIDSTGQPQELVMQCDGEAPHIALQLPCAVGFNLAGGTDSAGFNVTECERVGAPGSAELAVIIPLGDLPHRLNEPLSASDFLPIPYGRLRLSEATLIFTQVDPVARAFVGRMQNATLQRTNSEGEDVTCLVGDQSFWATPGEFL